MSYLGVALERIAKENKRSQKDIAESANMPRSTVNRYFTGLYKEISDNEFAELIAAVTSKPGSRAELVAARCEDVRNGPGADLVEITVRGKPAERKQVNEVKLGPDHERALAFLRSQIPVNPALGDLVKNMAAAMGMK